MKVIVKCQYDQEEIAVIDTDTLRYPMAGSMFETPDAFHGVPDPFAPHQPWEDFLCPQGEHRPGIIDNELLTDVGIIVLPRDGGGFGFEDIIQFTTRDFNRMEAMEAMEAERGRKVREEMGLPALDSPQYDYPTCPECGKSFDNDRSLKGHIGGAHRRGKR
jgi:hypothetical protein